MAGVYDLRPLVETYVNEPLSMSLKDAEVNSPLLLVDKIANGLLMRVSNLHQPYLKLLLKYNKLSVIK